MQGQYALQGLRGGIRPLPLAKTTNTKNMTSQMPADPKTFFVIRHKPTGKLLPARVLATHCEFDFPDGVLEPRLFKTESAAKRCATAWSQGVWRQEVCTESEGWEYPSYDYLAAPAPTKAEGRSRDHLEVVPCAMELLA